MLGYLCLALVLCIVLCIVLFGLMLVTGRVFNIGFNQGYCSGHRFPYLGSVQRERKHFMMPLVDQPEIKALFTSILGWHSRHSPHAYID